MLFIEFELCRKIANIRFYTGLSSRLKVCFSQYDEILPGKIASIGNNIPRQCHGHVLVGQQTVSIVPEIIPGQNKNDCSHDIKAS